MSRNTEIPKSYSYLFNAITDSIEQLNWSRSVISDRPMIAREIEIVRDVLINAQKEAEESYISMGEG